MWKDFKAFAFKGNLVDLAIAVVIGGAFGKIVTSLVADIIMPLVGILIGGTDLTNLKATVGDASIAYGNFLQTCIDFLIIAFCIFMVIRVGTKAGLFAKKEEPAVVEGPSEIEVLSEIRDLLKEKE
jgi:large conductance mechanosensitive channel